MSRLVLCKIHSILHCYWQVYTNVMQGLGENSDTNEKSFNIGCPFLAFVSPVIFMYCCDCLEIFVHSAWYFSDADAFMQPRIWILSSKCCWALSGTVKMTKVLHPPAGDARSMICFYSVSDALTRENIQSTWTCSWRERKCWAPSSKTSAFPRALMMIVKFLCRGRWYCLLSFFWGTVRCVCRVHCAERCRVAVATESLLPLTLLSSCSIFPTAVATNFNSTANCTFQAHFLHLLVQSCWSFSRIPLTSTIWSSLACHPTETAAGYAVLCARVCVQFSLGGHFRLFSCCCVSFLTAACFDSLTFCVCRTFKFLPRSLYLTPLKCVQQQNVQAFAVDKKDCSIRMPPFSTLLPPRGVAPFPSDVADCWRSLPTWWYFLYALLNLPVHASRSGGAALAHNLLSMGWNNPTLHVYLTWSYARKREHTHTLTLTHTRARTRTQSHTWISANSSWKIL